MIPQINIFTLVDVIGALRARTLTDNIYMTDNGRGSRTSGQGTGLLSTEVTYYQVLNWHVASIDVQTEIQIDTISFYQNGALVTRPDTPCAHLKKYGAPSGQYWAGVINFPELIQGGLYQYKMTFAIGGRKMAMDQFASINIFA